MAIQRSRENFKTALPHGDQAFCIKRQVFGVFQKKKCEHEQQKQLSKATSSNVSALRASFLVANHSAKAKKPFTIVEELILPAAKDICRELLGEASVQKVAHVPLSASTLTRQTDERAEEVEAQLLERINESLWYAVQVDSKEDVYEDMLCAIFLPTNTTAAELFKSLITYQEN